MTRQCALYYKGQLGTGRKSKEQRELEKEEVRFRVRRGKFRIVFDDIPDDTKKSFDKFDKFETIIDNNQIETQKIKI